MLLLFSFNWLLTKQKNIYIMVKLSNQSSIHSCCVLVRRFVRQHDVHDPPQIHRSSGRRDRELSIAATEASIANNQVTDYILANNFPSLTLSC